MRPLPLSSLACDDGWGRCMGKRFCGNGFAAIKAVTRFSSSVRTVLADTATAAAKAASKPAASSGDAPTAATNRALKGGSIIATVSGSTAAAVKRNRA